VVAGAASPRRSSSALVLVALAGAAYPAARAVSDSSASPLFLEADVGVDFVHDNGAAGKLYLPEIVGGGGALFDYDGDGDLDLYLVQSGRFEDPSADAPAVTDRLFRNTLRERGDGRLVFVDVTQQAELGRPAAAGGDRMSAAYGMGVASGDYDNDGLPDLYVTRLGSNALLHNDGDGTFTDRTAAAAADDRRWSVAASFFDYDRDGFLDLFIVNYVDWSVAGKRACFSRSSAPDYCGPDAYDPVPDRLLRNRGDGTFEDVTLSLGVHRVFGAALGVVSLDADLDGWLDVYVANDGDPNQLWHNLEGGAFRDEGPLSGSALSREGMAEAGMGVDAADVDGDGDEDLFLTHLSEESNTLYVNQGDLLFTDSTIEARLHVASLAFTGFGTAFLDYDNDGRLDVVALNGAVRIIEELAREGDPYPLGQRNQLFHNDGGGAFSEVSIDAGPVFQMREVSRAAVVGDLDDDGDADIVQVNNGGPARMLLNQVGQERHWVGLALRSSHGGRDALGAAVSVRASDGTVLWRRVRSDGGYASARDPRVLVGLGERGGAVTVRVRWVGGGEELWSGLAADCYHALVQGEGSGDD
jgi:hypothetical protein